MKLELEWRVEYRSNSKGGKDADVKIAVVLALHVLDQGINIVRLFIECRCQKIRGKSF
jgi:hypothetical protein